MNSKKYFTDYAQAQAFYDNIDGDKSIGSVRSDLRSELGAYIVQWEQAETTVGTATITRKGNRLIVTLVNGDKSITHHTERIQRCGGGL